jgi:hypothetical protein
LEALQGSVLRALEFGVGQEGHAGQALPVHGEVGRCVGRRFRLRRSAYSIIGIYKFVSL